MLLASGDVLAVDSETCLITNTCKAPDLVCVSWASTAESDLFKWDRGRAESQIAHWLVSAPVLVGHNAAYDMAVLANAYPDLLPLIFQAYDDNRITCTLIRQKLADIAIGRVAKYSLADLSERHLGEVLQKEDTWRLRYAELRDVPLEDWPPEAREYPVKDAVTTLRVYEKQEEKYKEYFQDEHRQARHAFWLHLMSCWGIRTDLERVHQLELAIRKDLEVAKETLTQAGLLRFDGTRDTAVAKARMESLGSTKRTPKGAVSLDDEACRATGDAVLIAYADYTHLAGMLAKDIEALRQGEIHARINSLLETGRISAGGNAENGGYNITNPARKGGVRECFVPRPGYVFVDADYDGLELRTMAQVCLHLLDESRMAEVLNAGQDPHLMLAAQLLGTTYEDAETQYKAGSDDAKINRQFAKCFHPDTEVLTRRGWVRLPWVENAEEIATPYMVGNELRIKWEIPQRLTTRQASGLVHLKNEGVDIRVTADHRMCAWNQGGEFVQLAPHDLDKARYWPNAGHLVAEEYPFDEVLLRLAVATQADGSYSGRKIRFGFTKARKIARFRDLFVTAFASSVEEGVSSQGVTTFVLSRELSALVRALLSDGKCFSWEWLEMPPAAMRAVVDEARFWDGTCTGGQTQYQFTSVDKENTDILQALATLTGHKTRLRTEQRNHATRRDPWTLSVKGRDRSRGGNLAIRDIPYVGDVFCVTTSTDLVLVRDGGIPVITHQCGNFGFAGGMGVSTFVEYAANNGIILTEAKAREIRAAWLSTFPEFHRYFARAAAMTQNGKAQIEQLYSGRFRGGVGYSQLCNSYFQGLGADAAKSAGWALVKACYLPGTILYGCRIVNFVHDQYLVEVPIETAAACAAEVGRIMVEEANRWLPDVPATTTPALATCWSKDAKAVMEDGVLVPWAA